MQKQECGKGLVFTCKWTAAKLHLLTLFQILTRTAPLKASFILVTLLIKLVYEIQPSTPSQHPASSSLRQPPQILFTAPSHDPVQPCKLLKTPTLLLHGQEKESRKSRSFWSHFLPGMTREGPPSTLQKTTTRGQLLGMLLTQGSSTDRGKKTSSSPPYPSNGITCVLQPVTADAAQTYIPARVSKATLKESHTGVHPSGNTELREAVFHLSCEMGDEHVTYFAGENSTFTRDEFGFSQRQTGEKMWQKKKHKGNKIKKCTWVLFLIHCKNTDKMSSVWLRDITTDRSCLKSLQSSYKLIKTEYNPKCRAFDHRYSHGHCGSTSG